jgi:hypothetical protein
MAAADSSDAIPAAEPEPIPVVEPVAERKPAPPEPAPEAAVPAATAPADSFPETEVVAEVQVELSTEERLALAADASRDLAHAEQALLAEDPNPPSAERREKLDTIRSLIDSAKAAYADDLRAAATLAHKARLLAEELSDG